MLSGGHRKIRELFKCRLSNRKDLLAAYRLLLGLRLHKLFTTAPSGSTKCSQEPPQAPQIVHNRPSQALQSVHNSRHRTKYWITRILSTWRSSFVKIHFNIIQPSTPTFINSLLHRCFPPKIVYTHCCFLPCPRSSFPFYLMIFVMPSKKHKTYRSHYTVSLSHMLPLPWAQIFPSARCSWTSSTDAPLRI